MYHAHTPCEGYRQKQTLTTALTNNSNNNTSCYCYKIISTTTHQQDTNKHTQTRTLFTSFSSPIFMPLAIKYFTNLVNPHMQLLQDTHAHSLSHTRTQTQTIAQTPTHCNIATCFPTATKRTNKFLLCFSPLFNHFSRLKKSLALRQNSHTHTHTHTQRKRNRCANSVCVSVRECACEWVSVCRGR